MPQKPGSHFSHRVSTSVGVVFVFIALAAVFTWQEHHWTTAARSIGQTEQLYADTSRAAQTQVRVRAAEAYGKLPLSFQANHGQTNSQVKFLARGQGYTLFLTHGAAVFTFSRSASVESQPAVVSLKLEGARKRARISGEDELAGKLNYFIGNNKSKWRTNISTYGKVKYQQVYPGIDVVYHGNQQQLEYDFVVAPNANPRLIKLAFTGTNEVKIDENGDLVLNTPAGTMRQLKPVAFQEINGERKEVSAAYRINESNVSINLGSYDKSVPLVIDPEFLYSTYLGGTGVETGLDIAVDPAGNAYITGNTTSSDFPVAGAFQAAKGSFDDAFVTKLNPSGTSIIYSTYLGANGSDVGNAIAIDSQGCAYVVGLTGSGSFPTTPGAFQSPQGSLDAFITKLSASGSSLVYSDIIGGENVDNLFGV
ncbi:MAG TPA: SBBP repeat-containing protein, partial [Pyrinomonadaceae bacterium]|nr:SBBP repeat-containing protein [Pyrinomonadaceae bacterium]